MHLGIKRKVFVSKARESHAASLKAKEESGRRFGITEGGEGQKV